MAKFCTSCGKPLPEGAKFCASCGAAAPVAAPAPVQPAPQPVYQAPVAPQPVYEQPAAPAPKKKGKAGLIVGVLLLVVALIVAAVLIPWGDIFGGSSDDDDDSSSGGSAAAAGSPEDAINLYYDVLYEGKADGLKSLAPQSFWDWAEDQYGVTAKNVTSYFKEEMQDDLRDDMEDEFGKNYKISFSATDEDELDDEQVADVADFLSDEYNIKKSSVTKVVQLAGVVEVKGDDDEDSDDMEEVYAVQIDGKWYFCHISLDSGYTYVSFPLSGLVMNAGDYFSSNDDDDDDDIPDGPGTATPAPNPPSQDEQVEAAPRPDPLQILQNIWDTYQYNYESFYTVGGDPGIHAEYAPSFYDKHAYYDNLLGTYKIPENWVNSADYVVTLTDGNVANDFCSAVYLMNAYMSQSEMEDFMNAMGQSLLDADWEGYTPDRILVCQLENQCVLVAFGTTERMLNLRDAAAEVYNITTWFDMPID